MHGHVEHWWIPFAGTVVDHGEDRVRPGPRTIGLEQIPTFMARFLFGLLIVVTAFIQATILPQFNPFHVSPDVILVLLFLWCANHGVRESLVWVFFTGLLLDVLSLDYFGTNALALVIVVLLAGLAHQRVLQANVLIPMVLAGIAALIHGIVLGLLRGAIPSPLALLVQVVVAIILVPVIYLVLRVFRR